MRIVIAVLISLFSVNAFAMAPMPSQTKSASDSGLVGDPAPEFTLPLLKGGQASLAQLREGKKTVLFFWATWCPHCHTELERLRDGGFDRLAAKGVKIILINSGETADIVQKYMDKKKMAFDVVIDSEDSLGEPYEIYGVPTFFFVDENGIIKSYEHELPSDVDVMFR